MNIRNSQFLSIEQLQDQYLKQQKASASQKLPQGMSFEEILQKQQVQSTQTTEPVKFSKHAANRLSDRKIELTEEQLERLNDGTKKAGEKVSGIPWCWWISLRLSSIQRTTLLSQQWIRQKQTKIFIPILMEP